MKECPITLTQMAQATFRPFNNNDWETFAGAEGMHPQIAEIGDSSVVVDETKHFVIIQVHNGDHSWGWEIPTEPVQLY